MDQPRRRAPLWPGWPGSLARSPTVTCANSPPPTAMPAGTPTRSRCRWTGWRSSRRWSCSPTAAQGASPAGCAGPPSTWAPRPAWPRTLPPPITGAISRIIAGWPAVALLIAVKLLSGILEHRAAAGEPPPCPATPPSRPRPAPTAGTPPPRGSRADRPRPAVGHTPGGTVPATSRHSKAPPALSGTSCTGTAARSPATPSPPGSAPPATLSATPGYTAPCHAPGRTDIGDLKPRTLHSDRSWRRAESSRVQTAWVFGSPVLRSASAAPSTLLAYSTMASARRARDAQT